MKIRIVTAETAPWSLLLQADPSPERVRRYVRNGLVFAGEQEDDIVASAVLAMKGDEAELMNLVVAPKLRRKGLGRTLLTHVLAFARAARIKRVNVGTGESSLGPLAFYRHAGFQEVGRIAGFFAEYDPPIVENGIACRDMIRLAIDL